MSAELEPYRAKPIWLSRIVERGRTFVDHPFLAALLVGGWIPVAATLLAVDAAEASTLFLLGQSLACLMVVVGPYDVWYFDRHLLPGFFKDADETLTADDDTALSSLSRRYDTYYTDYWWLSVGV